MKKLQQLLQVLQVESSKQKNQVPKQLFYDVRVKYDGKDYDLQNVRGLSGYSNGKSVKALLANGKLYANVGRNKINITNCHYIFCILFGNHCNGSRISYIYVKS